MVFGLVVAGSLMSLTSTNAQTELARRRQDTCDGTLPLPMSAYVLGFGGLFVGAVGLFLLVRWFGHSRQPIAIILFATAVAAVVFEVAAVIAVFADSRPIRSPCLGWPE